MKPKYNNTVAKRRIVSFAVDSNFDSSFKLHSNTDK